MADIHTGPAIDQPGLTLNPAGEVTLRVWVPVRGEGCRITDIPLNERRDAFRAVAKLVLDRCYSESMRSALEETGLLVAASAVARQIEFRCALGEAAPWHDSGTPLAIEDARVRLVTRPSDCWIQHGPEPPDPIGELELPPRLSRERPIVWVRSPYPAFYFPYWTGDQELLRVLDEIAGHRVSVDGISARWRAALADAGIIGDEQQSAWRASIETAKAQLAAQEYALMPNLLPRAQVLALGSYVTALHREGYFNVSGESLERRDVVYNEGICRYYHQFLAAVITEVTGEALRPSFCYLSHYRPGAILPEHTDRAQCRWNVSLIMSMEPLRSRSEAWPLYLRVRGQARPVRLGIGEAVIYQGMDTPHWRESQPADQTTTVCTFHFVPAEFAGQIY